MAVLDEVRGEPRQLALFPADRAPPADDTAAIQVRLDSLRLESPRQWGARWLSDQLWRTLHLDDFFASRVPATREGTDWEKLLRILVIYRLLAHKEDLFAHLRARWSDLFGVRYEVLLYDLTSTYFESSVPDDEADPRRFGYRPKHPHASAPRESCSGHLWDVRTMNQ